MVAQNCARLYRSNAILTASPGQLVLFMYDGALQAMAAARDAMDRPATDITRFETIHRQIAKARRIISELQGNLDFKVGDGEFAGVLSRLYHYYNRRLLEANLKKDAEPIREIENLLGELRNAWSEMLRKNGPATPSSSIGEGEANPQLSAQALAQASHLRR
jgi:flagellar protein FliS